MFSLRILRSAAPGRQPRVDVNGAGRAQLVAFRDAIPHTRGVREALGRLGALREIGPDISDEEILKNPLALNLERSVDKGGANG